MKLELFMKLFFLSSSLNSNKTTLINIGWLSLSLNNSPKDSYMAAKQQHKKIEWKEIIQITLCFNIKLPFFSSLTLHQCSKHLQDTLLTKLLDQFIELHNTRSFKRLENLTWHCIVLFHSMHYFEKLGVNPTHQSIYMKGKCGPKKHIGIFIYV